MNALIRAFLHTLDPALYKIGAESTTVMLPQGGEAFSIRSDGEAVRLSSTHFFEDAFEVSIGGILHLYGQLALAHDITSIFHRECEKGIAPDPYLKSDFKVNEFTFCIFISHGGRHYNVSVNLQNVQYYCFCEEDGEDEQMWDLWNVDYYEAAEYFVEHLTVEELPK